MPLRGVWPSNPQRSLGDMTEYYLTAFPGAPRRQQLRPARAFLEESRLNASQHRTRAGALHTYVWEFHYRARVPITHVTSEFHAAVADWWRNQTRLAMTRIESGQYTSRVVRIANRRNPLPSRQTPDADLRRGVLQLEGVGAGAAITGTPFILDHTEFGTLDTFNTLL